MSDAKLFVIKDPGNSIRNGGNNNYSELIKIMKLEFKNETN